MLKRKSAGGTASAFFMKMRALGAPFSCRVESKARSWSFFVRKRRCESQKLYKKVATNDWSSGASSLLI